MAKKNIYEMTLAFAGICQAAHLAQQLARHGRCPEEAYHCSLRSLTQPLEAPGGALSYYGGNEAALRFGLETMIAVLNTPSQKGALAEITRYSLGMIGLERKVTKNRQALNDLEQRLRQLDRQLQHFGIDSSTLASATASIYTDIVSPLGPRIQITGEQAILQNSLVQSRVRAALLTGVRSAMLWQQLGGGRLQLLFSRSKLVEMAKLILSGLPHADA
ncbi:high frequency lysogenization protein [Rosenbergiella nectarea]|uniref:High frequency lysogenization protein HflD homolog n=1 Tax=Rosenbergiella nectarea TaxID=988801 RepID=A0A1H9GNZ6_9GAMM|nr:high frequency lysogenization protein HflD [Rosenbergiella nectarea]SEQ51719.1 high frequency lysogenization protein [Rosenbergiella nectarea]